MDKELEYLEIVNDILCNDDFKKLERCSHHGISRYKHCMRVSYYSYKVSKLLHLNYYAAARGGLLHDYFFTQPSMHIVDRFCMFFKHPSIALKNASSDYDLSNIEKDIIVNHMFPATFWLIPTYAEAWVVSGVDKVVAVYEKVLTAQYEMRYVTNLYLILIMNFFTR